MDVTRLEQRAYIKTAVLQGKNARESHRELVEAVRNNALPYKTVAKWGAAFQGGRATIGYLIEFIYPKLMIKNILDRFLALPLNCSRELFIQHIYMDWVTVSFVLLSLLEMPVLCSSQIMKGPPIVFLHFIQKKYHPLQDIVKLLTDLKGKLSKE